jgi:hypothetical protein
MSDNEHRDGSEEEYFSEGSEEEGVKAINNKKIENTSLVPKNFEIGNGFVHIFPFKICHTGPCRVKSFFDTQIEPNHNLENNLNYTASFRGRILNGKRITTNDSFNVTHLKLQNKENNMFRIEKSREIKDYFVWKFDEEVPYNDSFVNLQKLLKNLEVLN